MKRSDYTSTSADFFFEYEIPKLAESLRNSTPTTEDEITPEQRSNKIAELLEKHDLYLEWFKVFCRYVLTLKDGTKREIWHSQGINAENLCDRPLDFLEDYDKQHTTERPTTDETLRVGASAQPQRPDLT
ncbi:MAG: hypothetical protein IJV55_07220 [Paludibacteraceae bacterium]|nr:hypothetical protein [Paludibacteraceae bacterium]